MEKQHLSLSEAADALNISERTARRWIKSGKLRAYKPGRDYWIPESAIKELVEESEVHPKAESRSLLEPSFNDVLEEERLSKLPEVLGKYITARIERHEAEVEAPDSPHFRTATSATLWLAGVEEELTTWADWAVNEVSQIMPTPRTVAAFTDVLGGIANVLEVMGVMFAFDGVKREAEERIRAMKDMPDALSARRLEKASAEAQASMERLQDLGKAANG